MTEDPALADDVEGIEWQAVEEGSLLARRDLYFGVSLAALIGFASYLYIIHPPDAPLPVVGYWDPLLVDWLFYASWLVFAFYVIAPLVQTESVLRESWTDLVRDRIALTSLAVLVIFLALGTLEPLIVRSIPFTPSHQPPAGFSIYQGYTGGCVGKVVGEMCHGSLVHPLGTTGGGKDLFLLTIAGTRTALQMTLITAAIIVPLGVGVGTFAGYVGGRVDEALMRYVDTQQTTPALFIYIALAVLYGPSLILMVLVFGLLNWGDVARLVRSEVLQIRGAEFVTAARGAGVSRWQVIRHHIIPNASAAVLSVTALKLPLLVIVEATLSYLEFGDPRIVSWGNVVSVGVISNQNPTLYWWVGAFPIGALMVTVLSISIFGTALQDALDPRHVRGGRR